MVGRADRQTRQFSADAFFGKAGGEGAVGDRRARAVGGFGAVFEVVMRFQVAGVDLRSDRRAVMPGGFSGLRGNRRWPLRRERPISPVARTVGVLSDQAIVLSLIHI